MNWNDHMWNCPPSDHLIEAVRANEKTLELRAAAMELDRERHRTYLTNVARNDEMAEMNITILLEIMKELRRR